MFLIDIYISVFQYHVQYAHVSLEFKCRIFAPVTAAHIDFIVAIAVVCIELECSMTDTDTFLVRLVTDVSYK